jgi:maleamate amidohydrolase
MDKFEDHCWRDIIPADVFEIYRHYRRPVGVGDNVALLAVDLYELAYQGGARPVVELSQEYPSSCGIFAWNAIEPTKKLLAAARHAKVPIIYTSNDIRSDAKPGSVQATMRNVVKSEQSVYEIRADFAPQPGDMVILKQRASAFFGTPLVSHLLQLDVKTIVVCGESTSGCVRASAVDGYSYGFKMVVAEECCFDRSEISHKISLFDLHHKYADVLHTDDIVGHLEQRVGR